MRWSSKRRDVTALGLTGAFAREAFHESTLISLLIITATPMNYLTNSEWLNVFGSYKTHEIQNTAHFLQFHVWYISGLEVRFRFAQRDWIGQPLNPEAQAYIRDGLRVLFEKELLISPIEITQTKPNQK